MDEEAKNFPSHMPSIQGGLKFHEGIPPYPMKFHHGNPAYQLKYHRGISIWGPKGSDDKWNPRKSEKVKKKRTILTFSKGKYSICRWFSVENNWFGSFSTDLGTCGAQKPRFGC